jgi:hypothetical protein
MDTLVSLDVVQQALHAHGVIMCLKEILEVCDGVEIGPVFTVAE